MKSIYSILVLLNLPSFAMQDNFFAPPPPGYPPGALTTPQNSSAADSVKELTLSPLSEDVFACRLEILPSSYGPCFVVISLAPRDFNEKPVLWLSQDNGLSKHQALKFDNQVEMNFLLFFHKKFHQPYVLTITITTPTNFIKTQRILSSKQTQVIDLAGLEEETKAYRYDF